ncbi:hypothetical protein PMZ80_010519 [Knufia obscura]|uniref:Nitroreductase domain-containing protein n=1 Tax=Knufia obscura TaxID=1635080 RepID=A0ABR0RAK7_9EURO|nr:hypothetical protein PMZ80_010519 [Knufia obscura]
MTTSIRISNIIRIVLLVAFASLLYSIFSDSHEDNPRKGRNFRRPRFSSKPTQNSAMASQYLKSIASRRSIYALSKESTISNARLQEILTETIKHSPSSFNNQAGRAVLLLGDSHNKLWELAEETVKSKLPPQAYEGLKPKLYGYKNGYGTVMFFEDGQTLKPYKDSHPEMPFDQWSEHSVGMLQIHTWDALELEGLGANLQHYNYLPGFKDLVRQQWNLPESWDLKGQLVFGKPAGQPKEKAFDQVEGKRLLVFGE